MKTSWKKKSGSKGNKAQNGSLEIENTNTNEKNQRTAQSQEKEGNSPEEAKKITSGSREVLQGTSRMHAEVEENSIERRRGEHDNPQYEVRARTYLADADDYELSSPTYYGDIQRYSVDDKMRIACKQGRISERIDDSV